MLIFKIEIRHDKTSFNERKWTDLISDPKSYGDFVETGPRALEGELKALNLK